MNVKPLNQLHYTEFIIYLKLKGLEYIEEVSVDTEYWMCSFIEVTPLECKLKPRCFRRDGGYQLK